MRYEPTYFDKLPREGVLKRTKDISPYVFRDDIAIAIDVALATNRPLLVSGKPGSGKSRLAEAVATIQGWTFVSKTITSRTRLEELTVEFDHLRRLNDAQLRRSGSGLKPDAAYYNPGIFWWAFNPNSARYRGMPEDEAKKHGIDLDPEGKNKTNHVVLLIDEIDKAEPDLPNDLLEPLDRRSFGLPNGGKIEETHNIKILTIITTNGERDLPPAFLRRCATLELSEPDETELITIAEQHFPQGNLERIKAIAGKIINFRKEVENLRRRPPGTGEFLDAIRACEELNIQVSDAEDSVWKKIESAILTKTAHRR